MRSRDRRLGINKAGEIFIQAVCLKVDVDGEERGFLVSSFGWCCVQYDILAVCGKWRVVEVDIIFGGREKCCRLVVSL